MNNTILTNYLMQDDSIQSQSDIGVLYLAYGNEYINKVLNSIRSLRNDGEYSGEILVVSGTSGVQKLSSFQSDLSISISMIPVFNDWDVFYLKSNMNLITRFIDTIYMDADTMVLRPISELIDIITKDETSLNTLYMVKDYYSTINDITIGLSISYEVEYTYKLIGDSFPNFNTGVLLFNKNRTKELFDSQSKEWIRFRRCDRCALMRVLFDNQDRFNVVELERRQNQPNGKPRISPLIKKNANIIHNFY